MSIILGQASCRIQVGISSVPGVVFPAYRIARSISVVLISGKGRAIAGTAGASRGISPASTCLCRRFLMRTALFSGSVVAGGRSGDWGSFKGGDWKLPVDLCHLLILKTSLAWVVWSSLVRQYWALAHRTALLRSLLVQAPIR